MEPRTDSPVTARSVAARLRITERSLQLVLGIVWIFKGLLKFQPHVLKPDFVSTFIRQMAVGQPTPVASAQTHMATLLSHGSTMWVTVFGLVEVGIGLGLLFRRSLKPTLVVSFVWSIGVYIFGEGLGKVLSGDASPLRGAPGAACFYVLLGLLLWPRPKESTKGTVVTHSSVSAHGLFGQTGSLLVWAAIWSFEAIIWMSPFNRTGNAISNVMADTAQGQPGWYAHLLNLFGRTFVGAGISMAVILAVISLLIGLGPLVSSRPQVFIASGIALALVYWVTGEGLGELLTGSGTNPGNGPIVALIGLSLFPLVPARIDGPTPAPRLLVGRPRAAVLSILAFVPIVAVPSFRSYDTGVAKTQPLSSSSPVKVASPSDATKGLSLSGRDNSSRRNGTSESMNMSAMAGVNVADPNWKYTGPSLPPAEVKALTTFSDEEEKGHVMQTPDCTAQPTSQQILGAIQYVQATSAAVARYKNLGTALADGYVPITNTLWPQSNVVSPSYTGTAISGQLAYPVVHYLNFHYMNRQDMLKPNTVDSLVYATTPYGPVLVAAMYLLPGPQKGPMPFGCILQWHAHTNICSSDASGEIDGIGKCGLGSHLDATTAFMTHVWQVPVAGGPLALDPSDLQVVEAAIMAQQQGLAPTTTGAPPK